MTAISFKRYTHSTVTTHREQRVVNHVCQHEARDKGAVVGGLRDERVRARRVVELFPRVNTVLSRHKRGRAERTSALMAAAWTKL